jgi:phage-related tail fiber protein
MAYGRQTYHNGSTPAINATNLNNFGDGIREANPAGMVAFFGNSTAPTGWLKCNGAAVSRSTYSELYTAIGTTYGSGDGSTTFNLPDLRAEFIRGLDDSRGVDTGRAIGSAQAATEIFLPDNIVYLGPGHVINSDGNGGTSQGIAGGGMSTFNGTFKKVRPRNVALLACIKY